MSEKSVTIDDMRNFVRSSVISYEQLVYILALWVFNRSEYSYNYEYGERAVCNHMGQNYDWHVCDVLVKLGYMEENHNEHVFLTNWRAWEPLLITKNTKSVPQCELISAIVYTSEFTTLDTPYQAPEEILEIRPFELNEFQSFSRGHETLSPIISRLISTVLLKLGLSQSVDEEGIPQVPYIYNSPPFEKHHISPFDYIGGIHWNTNHFAPCECPCRTYHVMREQICPNFSKNTKLLKRTKNDRWTVNPDEVLKSSK